VPRLQRITTTWSGLAPGAFTLRAALVFVVVFFQSVQVSESWVALMGTPLWLVEVVALPALFAILGYLQVGARANGSRRAVALRRARRVVPLCVLVVVGTAVVVGPAATSLSLRTYFSDLQTWSYFSNLIALPAYELPGVFEFNNDSGMVNQIVSIFPTYILVALTGIGLPRDDRRAAIALTAMIVILAAAAIGLIAFDILPSDPRGFVRVVLTQSGLGMLLSALLAMLGHLLRTRVVINGGGLAAAAGQLVLTAFFGNASWPGNPIFWILTTPALTYLTVGLAVRPMPLSRLAIAVQPLLNCMLLFSYPFQQLAISRLSRDQSFVVNFSIVAIPLGLACFLLMRVGGRWLVGPGPEIPIDAIDAWSSTPRRRRPLAARLNEAIVPIVLTVAIGLFSMLVMAMLFLALSRE
jgi:peptidoglycan/LPS O-acetylase OafA/YrhL